MPVPEQDGYRLQIDIPIPMRDGTRLATDLYLPAQPGVYPVLLERSPYGKHASVMVSIGAPQYLARHGFIVAIQDTRGRYASEGSWYPFRDEAWGANRDGYDTVEWLAAQPFSTGKVATFGGSFAGFNQYTLAGAMPPHLAATFPREAPSSLRREWVYRGGALEFGFILAGWGRRNTEEALRNRSAQFNLLSERVRMDLPSAWPLPSHPLLSDPYEWIRDYVARQDDEAYWSQWDIAPHHASFDRPSYHVAAWFDIFLGGSLRNFIGMRAQARTPEIRKAHKLVIGPWLHGPFCHLSPQGHTAGELDFGQQARWDYPGMMCRWFEHWLQGKSNGVTDEPDVRYFVLGSNQWKSADDWPPPGVRYRHLYLNNDRTLAWEPPASAQAAAYRHDPDRPVRSIGGNTLFSDWVKQSGRLETFDDFNAQAGPRDQSPIAADCLSYTTPPLEQDLEIAGPVTARLYVSSSAVDTDFVVRLCDVYPDGRSILLCDGIQRARYRENDFAPSLLEPGRVYPIDVDLWAISNLFRAGHRIQVLINSSSFPRYDVNPGTGKSGLLTAEKVVAENRIHAGGSYPSHIVLPCQ
jgi:putative CocE/NonD family hydrolase